MNAITSRTNTEETKSLLSEDDFSADELALKHYTVKDDDLGTTNEIHAPQIIMQDRVLLMAQTMALVSIADSLKRLLSITDARL